jgi:CRISPR/Cas system CSM-associated protein Csm3 (group 7 of RAMP superfamily)
MPFLEIALTVVPETGMSVGGSGSTGVQADKTMQRDGRDRPIIPASQVKGRVRHACEALLRAAGVLICRPPNPESTCPHHADVPDPPCPICTVFGSPWTPSSLRFRDLAQTEHLSAIRPGIGVDRRRGTAREELLFLTETTATGARLGFGNEAAISGHLDQEGQALLVIAGLQSIRNWGGGKSRGMGWATLEIAARFDGRELRLDECGKEVLVRWLAQHTES